MTPHDHARRSLIHALGDQIDPDDAAAADMVLDVAAEVASLLPATALHRLAAAIVVGRPSRATPARRVFDERHAAPVPEYRPTRTTAEHGGTL